MAAPVPQPSGGYFLRVVDPRGGTRKVRLGQRERATLRAAREASDPDHHVDPGLFTGSGEAGGGQAPEQRAT
eukprot:1042490-Alexandrium_andersonii.AAC.1